MRASVGAFSVATFASRVLGLVREMVFAHVFGAGLAMDAFVIAFRIPNLLRDIFAEGVMSAAFVPVYVEHQESQGQESADFFANVVLNVLVAAAGLTTILGILFAPLLVRAIGAGFEPVPGKLEITTRLTQLLFPFLLLIGLSALAAAILNCHRHFFVPALAPAMVNIGFIVAGLALCPALARAGYPPIIGMALGALGGGAGQLLIQIPSLWRVRFRYRAAFDLAHRGLRRFLGLVGPVVIGVSATKINTVINTFLVTFLVERSVSYLHYAFRLMQFPLGVFGVGVATVALPALSRHYGTDESGRMKETLKRALNLVIFLTAPCALLLLALAHPICRVLYEHGEFGPADTTATSHALMLYALGIVAVGVVKVLASAFYSLGDARTPMVITGVAAAVNVGLNLILMRIIFFRSFALATSVAAVVNAAALTFVLRRRLGRMGLREIGGAGLRVLLAAGGGALAAWMVYGRLEVVVESLHILGTVIALGVAGSLGAGLYIILASVLGVEDARTLRLRGVRQLLSGGRENEI
jgi:putative peptidoglycan lipid II flippase